MTGLWESASKTYTYLFDELSQPLTKDWLLVPSPFPLLIILLSYNLFCAKFGPMLMKNRPPFKLTTPIKLYNIFQIFISLYLFSEGFAYIFFRDFDFTCQETHDGDERVARGIQLYFLVKLIELLDTVFFVLRKSDRQVTFLHLYHHTIMPIITWLGLKYFPGGQGVIFGTINSLVHVFMYTYYFISGLGPQYQKYVWWKKYVTVMQIVQFAIVSIHSTNSLFYSCNFLPILKVLTIIFSNIFLYMFSKFYYLNYMCKPDSNKESKTQKVITNGNNNKREESSVSSGNNRKIFNDGYSVNGKLNVDSSSNSLTNNTNSNGTSNETGHTNGHQLTGKQNKKYL